MLSPSLLAHTHALLFVWLAGALALGMLLARGADVVFEDDHAARWSLPLKALAITVLAACWPLWVTMLVVALLFGSDPNDRRPPEF